MILMIAREAFNDEELGWMMRRGQALEPEKQRAVGELGIDNDREAT